MVKEAFMRGFASKLKSLGTASLSKKTLMGMRKDIGSGVSSPESFVAFLPLMAARKMLGNKKVDNALFKIQRKATDVDMILGHYPDKLMKKMPFGKNLFTQTDILPVSLRERTFQAADRASIMAPLSKGMAIATPLIVGSELSKGLEKSRGHDGQHSQNSSA